MAVGSLNGMAPALRRIKFLTVLVDLSLQSDPAPPLCLGSLQDLNGLHLNVSHGLHAVLDVSAASLPTQLTSLAVKPSASEAARLRFEPGPGGSFC